MILKARTALRPMKKSASYACLCLAGREETCGTHMHEEEAWCSLMVSFKK